MTKSLTLTILAMSLSATIGAQQTSTPPTSMAGGSDLKAVTTGVGDLTQAMITGTASDANNVPLPHAIVRLRDLERNEIEQVTNANATGEFSFRARPEVPYVVEVADEAGRVVAVGDVITVEAGSMAGTQVMIAGRLPAGPGLFSDLSGTVIATASGLGTTVLQSQSLPPVSPER